jgi:hypothetical protein
MTSGVPSNAALPVPVEPTRLPPSLTDFTGRGSTRDCPTQLGHFGLLGARVMQLIGRAWFRSSGKARRP